MTEEEKKIVEQADLEILGRPFEEHMKWQKIKLVLIFSAMVIYGGFLMWLAFTGRL